VSRQSDLAHVLQLRAHLLARPEGAYLDRQGQPCRHPGGLYSQSLVKVLTRMRELTATFEPEAHPQTLNLTWPSVMSALEALLVAVDAHADDLKTILAATGQFPAKGLKRIGDQIDEVFEELAGRPINRVKHMGRGLRHAIAIARNLPSTAISWQAYATMGRLLRQSGLTACLVHTGHLR
jgi:hypothetical protein